MRKKILAGLAILGTLTLLTLTIAFAGRNGPAGKSNIGHLYLYKKPIVPGVPWGKMKYNLAGPTFDFVFNGHGLTPKTGYSLIYYADGWPGNNPGALIGSGMTNDLGDIHLGGSVDLAMDLPHPDDDNYPTGAKIWLVLSVDYDADACKLIKYNPTAWLWEYNLISYDDTEVS